MPGAPDDVVFSACPDDSDKRITWGSLRANSDPEFRIRCLKARIEDFLLKQSAPIATGRIYAPYPLTTITLVGIGSLAEVFMKARV